MLRLSAHSPVASGAEEAQGPPQVDSIHARVEGNWIHLSCENHSIRLDTQAGVAEGVLPPEPAHVREDLLIYSLLLLMRRRGYYGLHASAVIREGVGYLFVAAGGSGKSTHTYSLVRRGWKYLADDAVFLRCRDGRVEALPLRRDLYLDPALARSFPEVGEHGGVDPHVGKRRLDMHALFPDRGVESCVPRLLFFPEITSAKKSRLVPLSPMLAVPRLLAQSLVFTLDSEAIPRHFEVVSQLASQTESFRLVAGRDLKEDPEQVADLLGSV
ncbi:MAG: hypothetical protein ABR527_04195 [Gemmatimonadota bacterium]